MTEQKTTIGPLSSRRRIATVVALVGIVIVAGRLGTSWPRDVAVAYRVGSTIEELDADYLQAGLAVASVRFNRAPGKTSDFHHVVRLQPGEYRVHITLYGQDGSAVERVRQLSVPASGLTRFDLRRAHAPSP